MKICIVSLTSKSGSSVYVSKLTKELIKKVNVYILGNYKSTAKKNVVIKSWGQKDIFPYGIIKWLRKLNPELVNIQYEYSMLGNPYKTNLELPLLLAVINKLKIKITITLHGVIAPFNLPSNLKMASKILPIYYKLLSGFSDTFIVLNKFQKKSLERYGVDESKLRIIPHGADRCDLTQSDVLRDPNIVLFHGFIRPTKGLDVLVKAICDIINEGDEEIKLKILGSIPFQWEKNRSEIKCFNEVMQFIKERNIEKNVEIEMGFLKDRRIKLYALKSYIIVLPYLDNYLESSGVLHSLMGCGTPIVASKTPRFMADLKHMKDAILVNPTPDEIKYAIRLLQEKRSLWEKISSNLTRKAKERSWSIIANMYFKTFEEILGR